MQDVEFPAELQTPTCSLEEAYSLPQDIELPNLLPYLEHVPLLKPFLSDPLKFTEKAGSTKSNDGTSESTDYNALVSELLSETSKAQASSSMSQ